MTATEPIDPASGLPQYPGPSAWTATDMRARHDWRVELDDGDVAELVAAARVTASTGVDPVAIDRDDFPLPTLGPRLVAIRREILFGRGFVLLRGIPVADLDRDMLARVYLGLGAWIGVPVPQNAAGHLLGHVRDIGYDPHNPLHRVYATSYRHRFHTDSCDVVGLLCLHPARSGGESFLVSSTSVYNRMAVEQPMLAGVLAQPFTVDRKGEIPAGAGPTYPLAVFHHYGGWLTTIYARDFIETAQRHPDVPRLTGLQIEAMDVLDALCERDELRLAMDFRPGDIQFLHNHQILHARSGYRDWPEPERKRHLWRLWLSTAGGRPLPPAFEARYGPIDPGRVRGGIRVPGQTLSAPLDSIAAPPTA